MKKNNEAFTLVEVLLVIGIIGVISALLLSAMKNNVRASQYINQARVKYSLITNLFESIKMELGDYENWPPVYSSGFYTDYIDKRLKYVKKVSASTSAVGFYNPNSAQMLRSTRHEYLMADGSVIVFIYQNNINGLKILFDINGNQPPNAYGVDVFFMTFTAQKSIADENNPYGLYAQGAMASDQTCERKDIDGNSYPSVGSVKALACNFSSYGVSGQCCLGVLARDGFDKNSYPIKNFLD